MQLVARREIRSIQRFLVYLLDMKTTVSAVLMADPAGSGKRKMTSERGAAGARKVHYLDFGKSRIGILEWDKSPLSDVYDVRLYLETSLADTGIARNARRMISEYPDRPGPVTRRQRGQIMELEAMAWFTAGKLDKAKAAAERILKLNPDIARAWNCVGACYAASNDNQQAILHYLRALQIDRSIFRVWVNLGRRYEALGDKMRSVFAYSIALTHADRYRGDDVSRREVTSKLRTRTRMNGYKLYLRQTRDKEINMLSKGTRTGASLGNADYGTGIALLHAGEYEKAAVEMSKALQAAPDDPVLHNDVAHCLLHAGKPDEALKRIEVGVSLDPNISLLLVTKAEILMKLSRHREALACYERALDLDATSAVAFYSKALAEDHLGLTKEAEKSFKHFIVVSNEAHESQINYARCRLQEFEYWRGCRR